jgi:hypothetical protein
MYIRAVVLSGYPETEMMTNEVSNILQSGCISRSWQKGLGKIDRGRQAAFLNERGTTLGGALANK